MTTFTYDAIFFEWGAGDNLNQFYLTDLSIVSAPGNTDLTYRLGSLTNEDGLREVDTTDANYYSLLANGSPFEPDQGVFIARLFWNGNSTDILLAESSGGTYAVYLGGAPLNITSEQDFLDLNAQITGISNVTAGPFRPGQPIDLAGIPMASIVEDDVVVGTDGDDDLDGGAGADQIYGLGGDDTISVGAGPYTGAEFDEYVVPGTGNDTVILTDASNPLQWVMIDHSDLDAGIAATMNGVTNIGTIDKGVNGSTTLVDVANGLGGIGMAVGGTEFSDAFDINIQSEGWLSVRGGAGGDDFSLSGTGTVRLDYRNAPGAISADLAAGTIADGSGAIDTLTTDATVRLQLRGSNFADTISGSISDETFILRGGDDTLDGGGGTDLLRYDRNGVESVVVDLAGGTAAGVWDGAAFSHTISNIENVNGSREGDDLLTGDGNANSLRARAGDDTLAGLGGDDTLDGGDGSDTALVGTDLSGITSASEGADGWLTIVSSQGTDLFRNIEFYDLNGTIVTKTALLEGPFSTVPSTGPDIITGGTGDDRVDAGDGNDTVNGGEGNDGLKGREGDDLLVGGPGDDKLPGEGGNDTLLGNDGNDRLGGGPGNDSMVGGAGVDRGGGGEGNDTIYGGEGDDWFSGGAGMDYVNGQGGNDRLAGSYGSDTVIGGEGNDTMGGGEGFDLMDAGAGDDVVGAGGHDDTVYGGAGNDFLGGGAGDDDIFGGSGDDTINSGYGFDIIEGGAGADQFVFNALSGGGTTVIEDFEDGIDVLRMTGLRNPPDPVARLDITDTTFEGDVAVSMTYGSHTVYVMNASAADFSEADFLFS